MNIKDINNKNTVTLISTITLHFKLFFILIIDCDAIYNVWYEGIK